MEDTRLRFDQATDDERNARIRSTTDFIDTGTSDEERWREPSSHLIGWTERSLMLAAMIKPGERVFEFGAGRCVVRAALPMGCEYAASDLTPLLPDVRQIDLNASTLAPIDGFDVALFSGVLEYVHDMPRLVDFLADRFRAVTCSYAVAVDRTSELRDRRRYSGWFNDFTRSEFVAMFSARGFEVEAEQTWNAQTLWRFQLSSARSGDGGLLPSKT